MYQLASRLYDSVERENDYSAHTTGRPPLVLNEERKMDPTLSRPERPERAPHECWWVGGNVDLDSTRELDYRIWVGRTDDLPSAESLLVPKNEAGQRWIPLICYPTWSEYREARPYGESYRSTWIHLESFLVPEATFDVAISALSRRNFFGKWMPEGRTWMYIFVGEYPWATLCNLETGDRIDFGAREQAEFSQLELVPVCDEVACEWEYDGTFPSNFYLRVPARVFFEGGPLWWDGVDGFLNPDGKTVFRDPSMSQGGPSTLLADLDDLLPRLKKLGCRLVWTLLGEKCVLGSRAGSPHRVTYSQTAYLNEDGTITVGDRVFFLDYDKDKGLAT